MCTYSIHIRAHRHIHINTYIQLGILQVLRYPRVTGPYVEIYKYTNTYPYTYASYICGYLIIRVHELLYSAQRLSPKLYVFLEDCDGERSTVPEPRWGTQQHTFTLNFTPINDLCHDCHQRTSLIIGNWSKALYGCVKNRADRSKMRLRQAQAGYTHCSSLLVVGYRHAGTHGIPSLAHAISIHQYPSLSMPHYVYV